MRDENGRFTKVQPDGREILDPSLEKNPPATTTVGAPGFAIYGGFIVEHEKDSRLSGIEKYRTYSDMLANVAIVAAGVRFFLNIIADAEWKIEPAKEGDNDPTPEAKKIADSVKDIMHSMETPWHRVVRRAAMFRFYGFSVQEWTAIRRPDGALGFKDIEPRPQITIERWETDRSGNVIGIVQRSPQTMKDIYLPREKCVYAVDDTLDDSPQGLGLFRHLAKSAARLERYEILEGWGFERDLRGTPIGRGPLTELEKLVNSGQLSSDQAQALRNPIETWIRNAMKGKDTSLFLDSAPYRAAGENQQVAPGGSKQWDIELLNGSGGPHMEIAKAIERVNRELARVLGVEQMLLGSTNTGSFALSKDKTEAFGKLVDATVKELVALFEADFLNPLFDLNGWDRKLKPKFKPDKMQHRDIVKIAETLKSLAAAGATIMPNDPVINEVRDLIGLSHAPDEQMDLRIPRDVETQPKPKPGEQDA